VPKLLGKESTHESLRGVFKQTGALKKNKLNCICVSIFVIPFKAHIRNKDLRPFYMIGPFNGARIIEKTGRFNNKL
jgi:hypothetical protein